MQNVLRSRMITGGTGCHVSQEANAQAIKYCLQARTFMTTGNMTQSTLAVADHREMPKT